MWQKIFKILPILFLIPSLCWAGIDFDDVDDFISVPDAASIRMTSAVTIAVWAKHDDVSAWGNLCGKPNGATHVSPWWDYVLLQNGTSNNAIQFRLESSIAVTSANTLPTNQFNHIVGTWDKNIASGKMYIFINGVEATTTGTFTTDITDGGQNLRIGIAVDGSSDNFDGIITEVAIWNVKLTDTEIALLANPKIKGMPLQIQSANLKGYWSINDQPDGTSADGDTVRDLSGNGNDGTGNDGANNTGLTWKAEEVLSYPDEFAQ